MKNLLIAFLLVTFNAHADCVPSYIAGSSGCGSDASAGAYDGNAYNRAVVRGNLHSYLYPPQAPVYDNQPHYNDAEHDVNKFDAQEVEDAIRDAREEQIYDHDTLMKIRAGRSNDLKERYKEIRAKSDIIIAEESMKSAEELEDDLLGLLKAKRNYEECVKEIEERNNSFFGWAYLGKYC